MKTLHCLFIIFIATTQFILPTHAQSFDYPNATVSTLWTNNISLKHSASFADGSTIRAILLRGRLGPSYACGFFCTGDCTAYLFAVFIVYTNSGSGITGYNNAAPQVIWSANRDRPVKENATLELSTAGNLILKDADGTVIWSTNTLGKSVVGMHITETGNLVLVDNKEASIWESFDHPTDSWVLGQTLREGQRLTSNVSATNYWTQGQLYLSISSYGLKAYVDSNPPQLYYQTGIEGTKSQNKSTFVTFTNGSLEIFSLFLQQGVPDATVWLPQSSSAQYMRLESDGHLRLYGWSIAEFRWRLLGDIFTVFPDDCAYPTVCGKYGICSNGQCTCPVGKPAYFRPVVERQPNLGCSPLTPLSCRSIRDHAFLALKNVSYFNFIDTSAVAIQHTNEATCKQVCLKNCLCKAALFQYGQNSSDGSCYFLTQVFSLMNNRPEVSHYNSSAYLKVQKKK